MSASLNLAVPKLGSGGRFKKLSATLAARGASDPDALAAFIGRKRYGAAGMGRLSHGRSLANPDRGLYLAVTTKDDQGHTLTCPECGHVAPAGHFGPSGTALQTHPGDLRTPAPGTGAVRKGVPLTVKGGAAHALAGTRTAVELAAGTVRRPIQSPMDVLVARSDDGTAVLRHRNGGAQIASLRKTDGKWVATVNGRDLTPRDHQRTSLMEAVGVWNGAIRAAVRPQDAPLQAPPQQTELMAEYGIPAVRALATPVTSSAGGPRMTGAAAGGGGGTDDDGLTAKGQTIRDKLIAKGFPRARAVQFAKQSQNTKPGQFGKAAA